MTRRRLRCRIKQILEKRYPGITISASLPRIIRSVSSENEMLINLSAAERGLLRTAGVIAKPTSVISAWSLLDVLAGMDPRIMRARRATVILTPKKKGFKERFIAWIKSVLGLANGNIR